MPEQPRVKHLTPVKQVKSEILNRLEVVSNHIYPLAGGTGRRVNNAPDPRFTKLQNVTGDTITFYEHLATVRDRGGDTFYVAFRETPDALFARSQDPTLFPEWLMKTKEKLAECQIFIYQVYRHPSKVGVLRSFEDWLKPIDDPSVFDTIVYFLGKQNVLTAEQAASY